MRIWCMVISFFLAASLLPAQDYGAAEYRDFKSAGGNTLRARLIKVISDKALLRRSTGEELEVPIAALSDEDQSYIRAWNPRERLQEEVNPTSADESGFRDLMRAQNYEAVPFRQQGNQMLLDVEIDGETVSCSLDAGRILTLVDREVGERLGEMTDQVMGEFPLSDGSVEQVLAATFEKLGFPGKEVAMKDFSLGVVDLEKISIESEGVLAADILYFFMAWIDWESRLIYMKPANR